MNSKNVALDLIDYIGDIAAENDKIKTLCRLVYEKYFESTDINSKFCYERYSRDIIKNIFSMIGTILDSIDSIILQGKKEYEDEKEKN